MKLIDVDVKIPDVPKSMKKERCWVEQLFHTQPFESYRVFHFGWSPLDLFSWEALDETRSSSLYFYRREDLYCLDITFENPGVPVFDMEPLAVVFGSFNLSLLSEDEVLGFVEGG